MIPVPNLDAVRCAWIDIRIQEFTLHGFLLYAMSDHKFPEYVDGDGLADLDQWSTGDCGIFVVHTPSEEWIEYTQATDHPWWKLFGAHGGSTDFIRDLDRQIGTSQVLEIGTELKTIREVFAPRLNRFRHQQEVSKILHRFDLSPTAHPCLILFRDLKDREVTVIDFHDLVDIPVAELRKGLKDWFGGDEFEQLIKEAAHHA